MLIQCPVRLPTESRPGEVSQWMKARRYDNNHIPCLTDVEAYRKSWVRWWMACQPSWRQDKEWPLPKERVEGATWGKLSARGRNGLFLVVMSTTWWASSLKSIEQRDFFEVAVDDIRWVMEEQLQLPPTPTPPTVEKDTTTASKLDPSTLPVWLQRKGSKRATRPSRRLLEGLT